MVNKSNLPIKCDKCEHEFFLNAVGIKNAIVKLNNTYVNLVYFACPKCNEIYRISIQDKRFYELRDDLERAKKKMQRYGDRNNGEMFDVLYSRVLKKHKRLMMHVERIHQAFPGTFVFVTSENNDEEKLYIEYRP